MSATSAKRAKANPKTKPYLIDDRIYETVVGQLGQWVSNLPAPDKPIIGIAGGEEGEEILLSPQDILDQVKKKTPQGTEFVQHWLELAVSHIAKSSFK